MTSNKPVLTPVGTVEKSLNLSPSYGEQVWAIADVEFRKMLRDPTEIFSRAIQPILWLLIFGQVFSKLRDIPTGGLSYLAFMAPGVLAQSVLFCAIFYGINVIWEKDMGVIHKLLVSPASRSALVLGLAGVDEYYALRRPGRNGNKARLRGHQVVGVAVNIIRAVGILQISGRFIVNANLRRGRPGESDAERNGRG